jgi:tetratricopeptide (TPR) repeat protein
MPGDQEESVMSAASPPHRRFRWRRALRVVVLLGLVAGGAWLARTQYSAWNHFRQGRAALDRDDPEEARRHFESCLETWPEGSETNYRAAQAARRCGDLGAALKYLKAADRLGQPADDIEVESALIEVQSGRLDRAESALHHHLLNDHPESAQILAILVPAYMAQYQWGLADQFSEKWVERCPDNLSAWQARAEILERVRRKEAAVAALRRVVELAPDDRKARLQLVRLILETKQSADEAAAHAERLTQSDPRDAAALVQLARCREVQSRTDEAVALLDQVIRDFPPDANAFYSRGRIELNRDPKAALPLLRRAAELDPSEPEVLYSLLLGLRSAGTPDEAGAVEQKWRQCTADLKRVQELGRAISVSPHDPELRREIGELFLRNGRDLEGIRWLESALHERPDHAPTHRVLAAYYQRTGQPERAAQHSSFIRPSSGPGAALKKP